MTPASSLFRDRRSVKPPDMDPERPVGDEVLREILEDAHFAPSHGLTQPWRFHVFTGAAKEGMASALWEIYGQVVPPGEQREDKRAKLLENPRRAPVCLAVLARIVPGGPIPEWEEIAATACAVQNLMLSAHARGLATFWSSSPAACSQEFAAWLGADSADRAMGLIYLGYALRMPNAPARNPLAENVFFHAG